MLAQLLPNLILTAVITTLVIMIPDQTHNAPLPLREHDAPSLFISVKIKNCHRFFILTFIYIDDCNKALDNDLDMHLKGVSESMKTDDRADMKSTGAAVSRERASREATKGKRQAGEEDSREDTRQFRGAFLNIYERIADKILSVDMISNNHIFWHSRLKLHAYGIIHTHP